MGILSAARSVIRRGLFFRKPPKKKKETVTVKDIPPKKVPKPTPKTPHGDIETAKPSPTSEAPRRGGGGGTVILTPEGAVSISKEEQIKEILTPEDQKQFSFGGEARTSEVKPKSDKTFGRVLEEEDKPIVIPTQVGLPPTKTEKVVETAKFYGGKLVETFDLSRVLPTAPREEPVSFITQESPTMGGTEIRRPVGFEDIGTGRLPPKQEFELGVQERQVEAGFKIRGEAARLQEEVYAGTTTVEVAQEQLGKFTRSQEVLVGEAVKPMQVRFMEREAVRTAGFTFATTAGVSFGLVTLAPPLAVAFGGASIIKGIQQRGDIAAAFAVSPKATIISTGAGVAGGIVGGGLGGLTRRTIISRQLAAEIETSPVTLKGVEMISKAGGGKLILKGRTILGEKPIDIFVEQPFKQIGDKITIGRATGTLTYPKTFFGTQKIIGFESVGVAEAIGAGRIVRTGGGLPTLRTEVGQGFRTFTVSRQTFEASIKQGVQFPTGIPKTFVKADLFVGRPFGKVERGVGIVKEITPEVYAVRAGKLTGLRISRVTGDISLKGLGNIKAIVRRLSPDDVSREFIVGRGAVLTQRALGATQIGLQRFRELQTPKIAPTLAGFGLLGGVSTLQRVGSRLVAPSPLSFDLERSFGGLGIRDRSRERTILGSEILSGVKVGVGVKTIGATTQDLTSRLKPTQRLIQPQITGIRTGLKLRERLVQQQVQPSRFRTPFFGIPTFATGKGFPLIKFPPMGMFTGKPSKIVGERAFRFQPSLAAIGLGITAPKIPELTFTGLVTRPIIKKKRRKKK